MLTFRIGEEAMAMPVAALREIVPPPRLTRVPHAPEALLGMAGIRGEVVPVFSAARLLGRGEAAVERVILAEFDGPVGLAVSAVSHMVGGEEAEGLVAVDMAALIARALPERRARRAGTSAAGKAQAGGQQAETLALIAFRAGGQDFALPLAATLDVLRLSDGITRMPLADVATLGSIGWRGQVLPLLSLASLLALPSPAPARGGRVIVVRVGGHPLGLVVDAMRSVERVREEDIDPVPPLLNRGTEARIQAICRLDGGQRLLSVLATDHLVSQDIMAALLPGERKESETMSQNAGEATESFLLFRIGKEEYGVPVAALRQVTMLPERLTPLPRAPDFVRGVMSIRGEIIPVIDQSRRFGAVRVAGRKARVLVLRMGELVAGFIVEEVRAITGLPVSALREAPDLGVESMRLFYRVASVPGKDSLVLIVSPQELLDRAEHDLLAELKREAAKTLP